VGTVTHIRMEAPGLRSYTFQFDTPVKHYAGQHYEIRLTSPDGYQAARLYSAAIPANGTGMVLQLTIANMPFGEVSPYIFNHVHSGSQLEIRGPLGGYFNWTMKENAPLLLVGGGTGVVPLRAIRMAHMQECAGVPLKLLYSVKNWYDMAYKYELCPAHAGCPDDVIMTFTEQAPDGWKGYSRRIDADMIKDVLARFNTAPHVYVCGPTPFVEAVSNLLVAAGLDPLTIKTERFGPTG
jgi:ferredoxin-NADP reductase